MLPRGKIYNREKAMQQNDFTGLQFGKITPTDIDGFIDFGNKGFVFIETKSVGAEMPYGQCLALERLADAAETAGIRSIVIKAEHNAIPPEDIDVANAIVKRYRYDGRWKPTKTDMNVRQIIEKFLKQNGIKL